MELPQLTQANPIGSALEGFQTGQKIQANNVLLEQNRLENQKLQQETNKKYAVSEARKIAYSGDPRAAEAMQLLASIDPDEGKKAFDWHKERSQRLGTYMTVVNNAPEKDKAKMWKYVTGQINSGNDPYFNSEDLKRQGLSDDWSSDKAPKVAALAQMHRDLENANKAPKEAADLEATKANTAKTYADIAKTRVETDQLKGGTKPLPAESAKTVANVQTGRDSINDIKGILKGASEERFNAIAGTSNLPNIMQGTEVQKFDLARKNLKDTLARMRTGAAINESEEKLYTGFIPRVGDSKETREYKLEQFNKLFNRIESGITGKSIDKIDTGAKAASIPAVGAIENGYEFLGGDPASKKSWRKK